MEVDRRSLVGAAPRIVALACAIALLAASAATAASLSTRNITPFPRSKVIVGASWTSPPNHPKNLWGDLLPTIWADDGNQYVMVNDGGTDVPAPGYLWKQSVARVTGDAEHARFHHVGDPWNPPPHTFPQIFADLKLWVGPIGPYYSSGFVEADKVFFATQEHPWPWRFDAPFDGLVGIAYSYNRGRTWSLANQSFPAPIGNLSWVIRGKGGVYPDGWVYAIFSEREFNATNLFLGRARPHVADITDPSHWQWAAGMTSDQSAAPPPQSTVPWAPTTNPAEKPTFSKSFDKAVPILEWYRRISYPEMAYDPPLHRYLLTFTFSYGATPPTIWKNGMDLVILEAPNPWGPFSFVAHQRYFGPSNGYAAGIPVKWISRNGRDIWLKWTANWDGCAPHLSCSAAYGFNYRRLHLTLAKGH